jgi:hypothetical protein
LRQARHARRNTSGNTVHTARSARASARCKRETAYHQTHARGYTRREP